MSTDNLNDLAKIFYASANRIIEAIDKSAGLHREIVQQLPTEDIDDTAIYMVLDQTASGSDIYDEWMWIENAWEHIGSTRVDLSDYYTKTQVDTALSGKANTSDIPTTLAGLSDDATHRVVTDTEKTAWNGKASSTDIQTAINNQVDSKHFKIYTKTCTGITFNKYGVLYISSEYFINYDDLGLTDPPAAVFLSYISGDLITLIMQNRCTKDFTGFYFYRGDTTSAPRTITVSALVVY